MKKRKKNRSGVGANHEVINNPVAKFNFNKGGVHKPRKGKGSYRRVKKYEYLYER